MPPQRNTFVSAVADLPSNILATFADKQAARLKLRATFQTYADLFPGMQQKWHTVPLEVADWTTYWLQVTSWYSCPHFLALHPAVHFLLYLVVYHFIKPTFPEVGDLAQGSSHKPDTIKCKSTKSPPLKIQNKTLTNCHKTILKACLDSSVFNFLPKPYRDRARWTSVRQEFQNGGPIEEKGFSLIPIKRASACGGGCLLSSGLKGHAATCRIRWSFRYPWSQSL